MRNEFGIEAVIARREWGNVLGEFPVGIVFSIDSLGDGAGQLVGAFAEVA